MKSNVELQREVAHREVSIAAGRVILDGSLSVPESPSGIVLFAHGSGSSRHSPRNRFVAVEEVASLVAWIASQENSFTTGAVFDISGGRATY